MPKGIRSYKKFVEAAFPVDLTWDGDIFGIIRWFPASRGFGPEPGVLKIGSGYDAEISNSVSPTELGTFILQQFDYIEKKRQGL